MRTNQVLTDFFHLAGFFTHTSCPYLQTVACYCELMWNKVNISHRSVLSLLDEATWDNHKIAID